MDETKLKSLKVAELKEKLQEHNLATTGNKSELIARLLAHNKQDGPKDPDPPAEPKEAGIEPTIPESTLQAAPELPAVDVDSELEKRKQRAARFGTETEEGAKKDDRAKRFGQAVDTEVISKLDQPLSDKRGRRGGKGKKDGAGSPAKADGASADATPSSPSKSTPKESNGGAKTTDAAQQELKRKRMEKFGTADPSKKAKV